MAFHQYTIICFDQQGTRGIDAALRFNERDGLSNLAAETGGRAIFNMSASFQIAEEGFDHHDDKPDMPGPEGLASERELAKRVIDSLPEGRPILFAPDRNLGSWLIRETGREMDLWQGTCIVHETFSERALIDLMTEHPDAKVIAHPECEPPILRLAHHVGSTSSLLNFTKESGESKFIVATEPGILHQMRKANPDAEYIPLPGQDETCACNECPFMRLNTLEKIYLALRDLRPRIEMDEELRKAAAKPLLRMLEV